MHKNRLEAFSDGVIAIIITIMVLELKIPHGDNLSAIKPLFPLFFSYVLSFIYVGIYWNNHHHLMQLVTEVNGKVLWANLHLLFWLSLFPFATAWMGENHFTTGPTALYGIVLLMAALAWHILSRSLVRLHGKESEVAKILGKTAKEKLSPFICAAAVGISFFNAGISIALYALVAGLWFMPDPRVERKLHR